MFLKAKLIIEPKQLELFASSYEIDCMVAIRCLEKALEESLNCGKVESIYSKCDNKYKFYGRYYNIYGAEKREIIKLNQKELKLIKKRLSHFIIQEKRNLVKARLKRYKKQNGDIVLGRIKKKEGKILTIETIYGDIAIPSSRLLVSEMKKGLYYIGNTLYFHIKKITYWGHTTVFFLDRTSNKILQKDIDDIFDEDSGILRFDRKDNYNLIILYAHKKLNNAKIRKLGNIYRSKIKVEYLGVN